MEEEEEEEYGHWDSEILEVVDCALNACTSGSLRIAAGYYLGDSFAHLAAHAS